MPRRNRIDPFGNLIADPARGALFGNRGVLHVDGTIVRRQTSEKRWIYCRLEPERVVEVLTPPSTVRALDSGFTPYFGA